MLEHKAQITAVQLQFRASSLRPTPTILLRQNNSAAAFGGGGENPSCHNALI